MRPLLLLLALSLLSPPAIAAQDRWPSAEEKATVAKLPEKYRAWIEEADLLLSEDERKTFLGLAQDYQRDAFIEQFWAQRDNIRRTGRNELRESWQANARVAREMFGDLQDGRSRVLLLNGLPAERLESDCPQVYQPLEAWFYNGSDRLREPFAVVFYRKWGERRFRIWTRFEGSLEADGVFEQRPNTGGPTAGPERAAGAAVEREAAGEQQDGPPPECGEYEHSRKINAAIGWVASQGNRWVLLEARFNYPQEPPGGEWVSAFNSYSTDLPAGAAALAAKLDVAFPGRRQNRTVVQGLLNVPARSAAQAAMGEARAYNFLLTGEVLREGSLLDSFRYRFDLPVGEAAPASLPLAFERQLRPGEYTLIVKLEDVNGGRFFREERPLAVPAMETVAPAALPSAAADPEAAEAARVLADAYAALRSGETTVQLVPPHGELQTGLQRFDALTTGPIASVTFQLDGKPVLTKKAPPFSVELDLGSIPRTRTLAVTAYDGAGGILASDELMLNAPARRFRVRLVEPSKGKVYESSLRAEAAVEAPEGETVERVEMYLNDTRVATLYQPPYAQLMVLPKDQPLAYVRAVAFLADGTSAEKLVFVNAPEILDTVNVDLVELYTTVLDRRGRPVSEGLTAKDFTVAEDGARQTIARCERVDDLPIHAVVALDVSASMLTSLEKTQAAALQFFQKMVQPKDRAALITFNDHPVLNVRFTKDVKSLAGGLAGLKAERGTSLYDSLVFSFYNFNGIRGRRALLLLSDGKDEGSRFSYEEALEFARRSGVTVYVIGLGEAVEKKKLARFAEETGGRAFFPRNADELTGIYAAVEEELRSQYLIAYQSSGNRTDSGFRTVELKVGKSGLEAKTMRGYYP